MNKNLCLILAASYCLLPATCLSAWGLPPPEDTPEEVLRTEIITDARSPIDGQPLTASQYAQLQTDVQTSPFAPELSPKIRELIFQLRLRRMLKPILPFIK